MDGKQKMAVTGAGMVAAGIGLSIAGAALIAPALLGWAADLAEKCSDRLGEEMEHASRRAGTVAGTLRRAFNEAARAGSDAARAGLSGMKRG